MLKIKNVAIIARIKPLKLSKNKKFFPKSLDKMQPIEMDCSLKPSRWGNVYKPEQCGLTYCQGFGLILPDE
jgi:hypothetical protein